MAQPLLCRSGGFFGLFADPHLSDTEIEGGQTAPVLLQSAAALESVASTPALAAVKKLFTTSLPSAYAIR